MENGNTNTYNTKQLAHGSKYTIVHNNNQKQQQETAEGLVS